MLNDDAFMRLVAEDVKNRTTDEQRSYLRMEESRTRWQRALQALIVNLDEQFADLEARERIETARLTRLGKDGMVLLVEFQTDMEERRRKINRFKFHVETRLDEAERLSAITSDDSTERSRMFEFLQRAITRHRELITENDYDYSNIDEALWAALDGHWRFDDLDLDA